MEYSAYGSTPAATKLVRLNSGGAHNEITVDALANKSCWEASQSGQVYNAADENGWRLVKPGGELVWHILRCLRNGMRNLDKVFRFFKHALACDSEYVFTYCIFFDLRRNNSSYGTRAGALLVGCAEIDSGNPYVLRSAFASRLALTHLAHMCMPLLASMPPQPITCDRCGRAHKQLETYTVSLAESFKCILHYNSPGGAVESICAGFDTPGNKFCFMKVNDNSRSSACAIRQTNFVSNIGVKAQRPANSTNLADALYCGHMESGAAKTSLAKPTIAQCTSTKQMLAVVDADICWHGWSCCQILCFSRGFQDLFHGIPVAYSMHCCYRPAYHCQQTKIYRRGLYPQCACVRRYKLMYTLYATCEACVRVDSAHMWSSHAHMIL